jgi:hypothetical protein
MTISCYTPPSARYFTGANRKDTGGWGSKEAFLVIPILDPEKGDMVQGNGQVLEHGIDWSLEYALKKVYYEEWEEITASDAAAILEFHKTNESQNQF